MLMPVIVATLGAMAADARAKDAEVALSVQFNSAFVRGTDSLPLDLSRFERNSVQPGAYDVDLYVNQRWVGRHEVHIQQGDDHSETPCVRRAQLSLIGIALDKLPDQAAAFAVLEAKDCIDITTLVPGSSVEFDFGALRMDLSIPQVYVIQTARGYVDPSEWDRGVTAGFADYNANAYSSRSGGMPAQQAYLGLNTGLNLGDWRFRHNGSYSENRIGESKSSRYIALSSYVQRDIPSLKSQLTVGEYFTPAEVFDSVPYTGVQIASDDRMLPASMRSFAPAIRGSASTNARVTVRQAGAVVYETTVSPGPFVIEDVYSSGYAGDLEVTVTEADGRVRTFSVPFAHVAQLLRPGMSRYSLVAGKYRDALRSFGGLTFLQATYQRGVSNMLTGYGGFIAAPGYVALQGGVALSTPWGGLSADLTNAKASDLPERAGLGVNSSGQSYRIGYNNVLDGTKTSFAVADYRFSSPGYVSFGDYAQLRSAQSQSFGDASTLQGVDTADSALMLNQRHRLQLNINQPIGRWGSVFVSGSAQDYWDGRGRRTSYQAGYSKAFGWGTLNVSAGRTRSAAEKWDTQVMVSVSVPLGTSSRAPSLSLSISRESNGTTHGQANISGTLGEFNQFGYGAYAAYDSDGVAGGGAGGANVSYRGSKANLNASFGSSASTNQFSAGVSGSVVAFPGGISWSPMQGETRAVVHAEGADGARLFNGYGGGVGANGYGVVTNLMPYQQNSVALDSKDISEDVELQTNLQNVAPRYGAVVMLEFPTVNGKPMLLQLRDAKGRELPIGAEVLDSAGNAFTMVGQGGRVFLRTERPEGTVTVRWGDSPDQQCKADYRLPESKSSEHENGAFLQASSICVANARISPEHHG